MKADAPSSPRSIAARIAPDARHQPRAVPDRDSDAVSRLEVGDLEPFLERAGDRLLSVDGACRDRHFARQRQMLPLGTVRITPSIAGSDSMVAEVGRRRHAEFARKGLALLSPSGCRPRRSSASGISPRPA